VSKITSLINRTLFVLSFVLAAIAVLEKIVNLAGYTIVREAYSPARLLEVSVVGLVFVITLLLREIRHELEGKSGTP
jgi:hypothetical protein